jgi:integral membrane protein
VQPYRIFRITAVAEAFSWAGLLVGMYLKRVAEVTDLGVWLFGRIHGLLFVLYLVAALWVARAERWSVGRTLVGLSASIPPFTSLIFERWVAKRRATDDAPISEMSIPS